MHTQPSQDLLSAIDAATAHLSSANRSPSAYLSPSFRDAIAQLEKLAKDPALNADAEPLLRTSFFLKRAAATRATYELYEEFLETRALLDALNGKDPFANPQLKRTFSFAQEEARAANITAKSTVAFIGSGPFPESALAIRKATGCTLTCIDHHPEAIVLSQELFTRLKINAQTICADARTLDYSQYTHIFIAVLARPKSEIIDTIIKTCPSRATIICRTADGLRQLIYEPLDDFPAEKLFIQKTVRNPNTIVRSIIFKRRNTA
ncbi:hypothetical protein C4580_00395 [Candidatus Woesearchaeota archaeon]|nr:MAG: hypothetical protein C4580_00395 [Candidatus Woesearchaeota archaeon]